MAFENTPNKRLIREKWDLPLLLDWAERHQRKPAYFGLPGPEMLDIVAWNGVLDSKRWTAVEETFKSGPKRNRADAVVSKLKLNAHRHKVLPGLQVLRGDIGKIILEGVDESGVRPSLSEQVSRERARFSYGVVNLDFDGGIGHIRAKGEVIRIEAVKELVRRQRGTSFVLLITVNVRDTLGKEISNYVDSLGQRADLSQLMAFYQSCGAGEAEHRLKAAVPLLVLSAAERDRFKITCYPPISYAGYANARMVHFAFDLDATSNPFPAVSAQQAPQLLRLPLLRAEGDQFVLAGKQHPKCDLAAAASQLVFLPPGTRAAIFGGQSDMDAKSA